MRSRPFRNRSKSCKTIYGSKVMAVPPSAIVELEIGENRQKKKASTHTSLEVQLYLGLMYVLAIFLLPISSKSVTTPAEVHFRT